MLNLTPAHDTVFNVIYIGAGNIMFGENRRLGPPNPVTNLKNQLHLLDTQARTKAHGTTLSALNCSFALASSLSNTFSSMKPLLRVLIYSKLQTRLKVVAVVDPMLDRIDAVLKSKRQTFVEPAYRDTLAVRTIEEFLEKMTPETKPRCASSPGRGI
jgi:hypothetical protein